MAKSIQMKVRIIKGEHWSKGMEDRVVSVYPEYNDYRKEVIYILERDRGKNVRLFLTIDQFEDVSKSLNFKSLYERLSG